MTLRCQIFVCAIEFAIFTTNRVDVPGLGVIAIVFHPQRRALRLVVGGDGALKVDDLDGREYDKEQAKGGHADQHRFSFGKWLVLHASIIL